MPNHACEDFVAIKARVDELRRERSAAKPSVGFTISALDAQTIARLFANYVGAIKRAAAADGWPT